MSIVTHTQTDDLKYIDHFTFMTIRQGIIMMTNKRLNKIIVILDKHINLTEIPHIYVKIEK